ncbi:MAG: glycosyltransferase family 4 protein [Deltaproteobacteria bacterium]|nr:glycosyltransferase family 4 protein [Deltaproteobacteria bacterium]
MRIGINALYLLPGKVGGSETYIRNLVRWLPEAEGRNSYTVFVNNESSGVFKASSRVEVVDCGINAENRPKRILWEQTRLPMEAKRRKLDCLLSAGMTAPFVSTVPSFVVIYDLQHVNQPENFGALYLLFLKSIIYMSAKRSRGVITLSEKSKKDIVSVYGIRAEDVGVTYLACDTDAFRKRTKAEIAGVRAKYRLPERFILYSASSLPHKNYQRLLEAFRIVKGKDASIKLVLTGARDYGQEAILGKIESLGLKDDVVFLGWLPFEDMPVIYSAAELYVFPSLHEGFGIPVLEAFASGVPVVCSKIEPVTEVAASAAFYIDPMSAEDIAGGILKVLGDKAMRERLALLGSRRASEFSWKKTAIDTLAIIERSLAR